MTSKVFCVSSVVLESPKERMEESKVSVEDELHDVPSNEEAGQSKGSISTSNEGTQ